MSDPPPARNLDLTDVEWLIRFEHPDKALGALGLPGATRLNDDAIAAAVFDTSPEVYRQVRDTLLSRPLCHAEALLRNARVRTAAEKLPFQDGDCLVALGDSITADYESWAEILRHLLRLARPTDEIRLINHGLSGDTTADVISRLVKTVDVQPDWLIALIGTNDARRHGARASRTLVSPEETVKNLATLRSILVDETNARLVWLTPPPVIEEKIQRHRLLAPQRITWRNSDLAQVADITRELPDLVVDLADVFPCPPPARFLLDDGLHPSRIGQGVICRQLLEILSGSSSTTSAGTARRPRMRRESGARSTERQTG